MYLLEAIQSRLDIGKERYGHGVLVEENREKNWKRELLEEMLDGVVYAAANVLKKHENDDDNTAIRGLIRYRLDASATIADDEDTQLLDLVLFAADAVFKLVKNDLGEPQSTKVVTSLPDP